MDQLALLVAATLNSGTVLAFAALGLLDQRARRHRQPRRRRDDAGRRDRRLRDRRPHRQRLDRVRRRRRSPARCSRRRSACCVIWLNTNQYATGLALSLFGAGFSAFVGIRYTQEKLGERHELRDSRPGRHPVRRPGLLPSASDGLPRDRADGRARLVPLPLARRAGAARGRRIARIGACARLSGAAHPARRGDGRRRAVRRRRAPTSRSSTRRSGSRA